MKQISFILDNDAKKAHEFQAKLLKLCPNPLSTMDGENLVVTVNTNEPNRVYALLDQYAGIISDITPSRGRNDRLSGM